MLGASPPISMREVMAEAEAEQKRKCHQKQYNVNVEGAHRGK